MRALRWAGYALGGLAVIVCVAAAGVYTTAEIGMRRTYEAQPVSLQIPDDAESIAEGERLARLRGCYGGCHGTTLEGRVFFQERFVATIPAPNLTQVVQAYSDEELERVIRRGIRANGRSVYAMPSDMFAELADDDLASIIAFLRSVPPIDGPELHMTVGPMGRVGLVLGMFKPIAPGIPAARATTVPRDHPVDWGRYLVRTTCTECHGMDLRGAPGTEPGTPPDLRIAAAFDEAQWFALLRDGRGLGDRELGLMGDMAASRFQYFTDAELRAIHAYLRNLASPDT